MGGLVYVGGGLRRFLFLVAEGVMRKIRYAVAMSLDGYIADSKGGADWIVHEPEIDFAALLGQFDTLLIGRKTYETMVKAGRTSVPGMKIFVFSRTMRAKDFPGVAIIAKDAAKRAKSLRGEEGKDIWLFGGGELFRELLAEGLVDTVEVTVSPVLLGGGTRLLGGVAGSSKLRLEGNRIYGSGVISLTYEVVRGV
jgi:dihydrofolate reductase